MGSRMCTTTSTVYLPARVWAMGPPIAALSRTLTAPEEPDVSVASCATWPTAYVPTATNFPPLHSGCVFTPGRSLLRALQMYGIFCTVFLAHTVLMNTVVSVLAIPDNSLYVMFF